VGPTGPGAGDGSEPDGGSGPSVRIGVVADGGGGQRHCGVHRAATPDEAVELIRPRDTVGFGLGPGIPHALMTALGRRTDWEDLVLGGALLLDLYEVCRHPGVSYRAGFFGPIERILAAEGHRVGHVPGGFRQFAPILRAWAPRVMVVQAAPDGADRVSLSLHVGATRDELVAAGRDPDRLLIVERNPNLPRTSGIEPDVPASLPLDLVDVVVDVDHEPFSLAGVEPTETERAVAGHACRFVEDGATLQTGIGAVPAAVAATLAAGPGGGYGVHSEMFTDGLRLLHQAGKVTNTAKALYPGVSVTTFALGSAELHRWLDGNDEVAFLPVDLVNDPAVIARQPAMVSINGALAIDLYGQVVADHIAGTQISGVGGHEDFIAGTELRLDSHALVCLTATAEVGGQVVSRITPELPRGAIVSTPRHHLDVVVTEHGAVELRGLTVPERAEALASIADPAFRDELLDAAARIR
jgi:acyl-CoA hydrolase